LQSGTFSLTKNRKIATGFKTTRDFTVTFDIKPTGKQSGWSNIVHFTKGGNCCGSTQRIPAFFMKPNSLRMHCIMGSKKNGNSWVNSNQDLPMNQWTSVKMVLKEKTLSIYQNGKLVASKSGDVYKDAIGDESGVDVFTGDPWYKPAKADIKDLTYCRSADH